MEYTHFSSTIILPISCAFDKISDAVEEVIGHAPGGVCPFGINDGVEVYLDKSLKKFTIVYPAAGNDHSAVKLTIPELEQIAGAKGWVDVCKEENV